MNSEVGVQITAELYFEITNFLYLEAYYLDHGQYNEWLDLLTDDIKYRMPLRETVEGVGANNISEDMAFFDESKAAMTTRVKRLYTKSAWVENPATRQRHFISNIMVKASSLSDEYEVRSYFLFKRSRGSGHQTEELFGERNDVIRKVNGEWKIAARTIIPDQSVITLMNMSMFL
ncbi:aromatic-ring-hydroxylating dioxygenase subunit beta [Bacillus sp. FJAT-50079]|uniref:aromatic-ring-hydroxylating dioxygenase subunit beta n=1 Tax=Bacillus sp. FJAT-50079 TaxID=2833577 RepID=UPI001BC97863|nr:aromatic-ring-hydroxylating dioxygenase subunit beta [Bacillus sp. FJAT-50079]MBS4208327.1 aromatic-ring-hydroxylating dioxygenase subunit beta [Bacillus sp. FJAT-50079]